MGPLQAIILGIIQGLTEFLPVSSSAHLVLVPRLLGWPEHTSAFDVALHMGTLVAVVAVFGRDLLGLAAAALTKPTSKQGRFGWQVAIATIPAAVIGFALQDWIDAVLRNSTLAMAAALAIMGVLLWIADRVGRKALKAEQVSWGMMLAIGCSQALALLPGVSRSGVTITTALFLGLQRDDAARLSFYLSFPIIAGAGLLKLRHLSAADLDLSFWLGIVTASVVGYVVIRALLKYLQRGSYMAFAVWRIVLAVLVLALVR